MHAPCIRTREPLFFMHIPKTAGMSMRLYLRNQYHREDVCPASRWQEVLGVEGALKHYPLVQGHFRYNFRELLGGDRPMLVLLRDPIRRTISALRHVQRDPLFDRHYDLAKSMTLPQLLRHPGVMRHQQNVQARFLCAARPAMEVCAYLARKPDGDAGEGERPPQLELAQARLESIDYIGLTEDFRSVVSAMAPAMHFHSVTDVPFVNQAPVRDDPLKGLTEEDLAILREYNDIDLQLYELAKRARCRKPASPVAWLAPKGSFEIPLVDVVPGAGWYDPERNGDLWWRWTGPSRHFTIEVPLSRDASYRVIVDFLGMRPLAEVDLKAEVDGVPTSIAVTSRGKDYRCDFVIPRILARSQEFCCIRFDVGKATLMTPPDPRPLGVSVARVAFERVDG